MLLRIWLDWMNPQQFKDIANEIEILHKLIKNMIKIVFATSPLLALSSHDGHQNISIAIISSE
jgi:hypothetical protein